MKIIALLLLLTLPVSADIYEQRTYTPHDGKMENLLSRFRDHTIAIFESHGIKNIGYWLTEAKDGEPQKLTYIVAHKDAAAAKANWSAFSKDPKWQVAYKDSITQGRLVKKITSVYLTPVDFSNVQEMKKTATD